MSERRTIIETDIPARLDRLPWTGFHTPRHRRPRHHLDPRRPRGDVGRLGCRRVAGKPGAAFFGGRGGCGRQRLSRGCGRRRAAVRLSDRPVRPPQAVLCDVGGLPDRDCGDRLLVGFRELCAVPLSDRRRHRRRIRRDQLGDPGIGAGAVSRAHRSRDQRQLLAGCSTRRVWCGHLFTAGPAAARSRLAGRLWDRCGTRPRDIAVAAPHSGKPALADAARPPA